MGKLKSEYTLQPSCLFQISTCITVWKLIFIFRGRWWGMGKIRREQWRSFDSCKWLLLTLLWCFRFVLRNGVCHSLHSMLSCPVCCLMTSLSKTDSVSGLRPGLQQKRSKHPLTAARLILSFFLKYLRLFKYFWHLILGMR